MKYDRVIHQPKEPQTLYFIFFSKNCYEEGYRIGEKGAVKKTEAESNPHGREKTRRISSPPRPSDNRKKARCMLLFLSQFFFLRPCISLEIRCHCNWRVCVCVCVLRIKIEMAATDFYYSTHLAHCTQSSFEIRGDQNRSIDQITLLVRNWKAKK